MYSSYFDCFLQTNKSIAFDMENKSKGGIQALEAMLYTLDKINEDKVLLPNIIIGAHILDDCDRDSYGLEMAVDFIKGMFSINLKSISI